MGRKIYIGRHLEADTSPDELRDICRQYGRVESVWVARMPPGFAYVTFAEEQDADACVRGLNGFEFHGRPLRVEMAKGPRVKRRRPNNENYRRRSISPYTRRARSSHILPDSPMYHRSRSPRRSPNYRSRSPDYYNDGRRMRNIRRTSSSETKQPTQLAEATTESAVEASSF